MRKLSEFLEYKIESFSWYSEAKTNQVKQTTMIGGYILSPTLNLPLLIFFIKAEGFRSFLFIRP